MPELCKCDGQSHALSNAAYPKGFQSAQSCGTNKPLAWNRDRAESGLSSPTCLRAARGHRCTSPGGLVAERGFTRVPQVLKYKLQAIRRVGLWVVEFRVRGRGLRCFRGTYSPTELLGPKCQQKDLRNRYHQVDQGTPGSRPAEYLFAYILCRILLLLPHHLVWSPDAEREGPGLERVDMGP